MASPQVQAPTRRANCYCHACRRSGFKRSELTPEFLCPECAATPGVRGYEDPKTRGLRDAQTRDYWKKTTHHLRVVTDDDSGPPVQTAPTGGTDETAVGEPRARTFKEFQARVLALPDLTDGDKLFFTGLVEGWADHKTGANCAPKLVDIAARYGRAVDWARRRAKRLKARGLIEVIPLRSRRGWAQNLYRFVGFGWASPIDASNLKHLKLSETPRPRGTRGTLRRGGSSREKVPTS